MSKRTAKLFESIKNTRAEQTHWQYADSGSTKLKLNLRENVRSVPSATKLSAERGPMRTSRSRYVTLTSYATYSCATRFWSGKLETWALRPWHIAKQVLLRMFHQSRYWIVYICAVSRLDKVGERLMHVYWSFELDSNYIYDDYLGLDYFCWLIIRWCFRTPTDTNYITSTTSYTLNWKFLIRKQLYQFTKIIGVELIGIQLIP